MVKVEEAADDAAASKTMFSGMDARKMDDITNHRHHQWNTMSAGWSGISLSRRIVHKTSSWGVDGCSVAPSKAAFADVNVRSMDSIANRQHMT